MMAVQFASRFCCETVSVGPGVCSWAHTLSSAAAMLSCAGSTKLGTEVSGLLRFVALPGPVEILIATALPAAVDVPAAGFWLKTALKGMPDGLGAWLTAPTTSPAACNAFAAVACDIPTTLGTATAAWTVSVALAVAGLLPRSVCRAPAAIVFV